MEGGLPVNEAREVSASGGSKILKRGGGGNFFRGAAEGGRSSLVERAGEGADFEGLYYQLRSDCTRPEAVMGVGAGGSRPLPLRESEGYYPQMFFKFVSVRMCIFES